MDSRPEVELADGRSVGERRLMSPTSSKQHDISERPVFGLPEIAGQGGCAVGDG